MDDWLDSRPILRPDLRLVPDPTGGTDVRLDDPVTGDSHRIHGVGLHIASMLDGEHRVRDILAELVARFGRECPAPSNVREFIEMLDRRLMLVGTRSESGLLRRRTRREALRRVHMGIRHLRRDFDRVDPEDVEVRRGLRYECLSCGACCSGRFHVELSDIDLERLEALDLEGKLGVELDAHIRRSYLGHDDPDKREERRFLRHIDGRCAFLSADNLCEIHRHFGYEHKPLGCRIFPFYPVLTPDGAVLQFRPECSTQQVSAVEGPLIAPRRAAIWNEIVAELPGAASVPVSFEMRRDVWTDYRSYRKLEQRWLDLVEAHGWRATLDAVADDVALRRLDDLATLQRLIDASLAYLAEHPRSRSETFDGVVSRNAFGTPRFVACVQGLLGALGTADPATTLSDVGACQALLTRPDVVRLERQLDDYVADFLFGKFVFRGLSVASGAALMTIVVVMTRITAAWAAVSQDRELDAEVLNESLLAWHTALFNLDDVRAGLLVEHRDALEALVGLPSASIP